MPAHRYRKTAVVTAIQFTGHNLDEVLEFSKDVVATNEGLFTETMEGRLVVKPGNYILRGVQGEVYPCEEQIFLDTYERVDK